jgi:hypothetical protein
MVRGCAQDLNEALPALALGSLVGRADDVEDGDLAAQLGRDGEGDAVEALELRYALVVATEAMLCVAEFVFDFLEEVAGEVDLLVGAQAHATASFRQPDVEPLTGRLQTCHHFGPVGAAGARAGYGQTLL